MNNKVLVVGGAGYIGGFLTDHLSENNYDVTVYDSLLFENRFLKDCKFIKGDIRDSQKLNSIVHNYDTVVWLAGMVGDGACQVNPKLTQEVNVDSFLWLVDNYKGKIIFPSTCSVYGVNNDLIDETAEPNPLSLYAATKLEAEKYVLEHRPDSLVFRLGTLFGLGDRHSRMRLDLVANILSMRAAKGEELTVFGGDQWRPLLHVRDVSTAILHGLNNDISGIYNLSYQNFKIDGIADEIKKVIPKCKVKYVDMKFEDLRNYKVKNDKYINTGWNPSYTLADGVEQISSLILENRIRDTADATYSNAAYIRMLHNDE
jgi:nucleoside-diphosphate-sugar epimerase